MKQILSSENPYKLNLYPIYRPKPRSRVFLISVLDGEEVSIEAEFITWVKIEFFIINIGKVSLNLYSGIQRKGIRKAVDNLGLGLDIFRFENLVNEIYLTLKEYRGHHLEYPEQ